MGSIHPYELDHARLIRASMIENTLFRMRHFFDRGRKIPTRSTRDILFELCLASSTQIWLHEMDYFALSPVRMKSVGSIQVAAQKWATHA